MGNQLVMPGKFEAQLRTVIAYKKAGDQIASDKQDSKKSDEEKISNRIILNEIRWKEEIFPLLKNTIQEVDEFLANNGSDINISYYDEENHYNKSDIAYVNFKIISKEEDKENKLRNTIKVGGEFSLVVRSSGEIYSRLSHNIDQEHLQFYIDSIDKDQIKTFLLEMLRANFPDQSKPSL